jgi:hypothetical protein
VARETRGQSFNRLAEDGPASLERLSGMARLTALPVRCTRVEPRGTVEARASGGASETGVTVEVD